MNLATLAQSQAERYGSRPLALVNDEAVSYEQLADRAARFTTGLQEMGIGRGDRVAIMMGNRSDFLYAWLGILKLAAIEVPIHDAARGPGISAHPQRDRRPSSLDRRIGARSSATSLPYLADAPSASSTWWSSASEPAGANGGVPIHDFADLLPPTRGIRGHRRRRAPSSPRRSSGPAARPARPRASCCRTITTSTSGPGTAEVAGYTEEDVLLSVFPLFHANAKYMTLVAAMVSGAQGDHQPALFREPLLGPVPQRSA